MKLYNQHGRTMSQTNREQLKVVSERAVLAGLNLPGCFIDPVDRFAELRALTETAGASIVGEILQRMRRPRGATFFGKGKVGELSDLCEMTNATLVIFDHDLTPAQIRNLEQDTNCKIIDRSELILDIFANRATTAMAKLQVEIAQLEYTYPRLRAMWDHLGQVTGGSPVGIGTRGPGEQQIEIDRRLVKRRLSQLRDELVEIQGRKTREVSQRNTDHFTVGLVGYTNAGKSTLFNRATNGGAFSHDKLFATLATRIERWDLGGGNHVMLSDTVGFIRDLPHRLVASFRSTLEETVHSQLLLIMLDASDRNAPMQLQTVGQTLKEIGAADQPRILVLNKLDLVRDQTVLEQLRAMANDRMVEVFEVSAVTGQGIDALKARVLSQMKGELREIALEVPLADSRTVNFLERRTEVLERDYQTSSVVMRVRIGKRQMDQVLALCHQLRIDGQEPHHLVRKLWPQVVEIDDEKNSGFTEGFKPLQW